MAFQTPGGNTPAFEDEDFDAFEVDKVREQPLGSALNDYRTMQDIVFTRLRDEILSGKLRPGDRLNTTRLADRLGVSRMPVREALARLASAGLVENVPHRGASVKKLSVEEVIEIYYIRAALEGMAARLATRHLTESDISRLRRLCDTLESNTAVGDDAQVLAANQEFHTLIYHAAQSPRLEDLIMQYYRHSTQYRALGLDLPGRYAEIAAEHRSIVEALAAGDPDAAEVAARTHHLNTARRIARSAGSSIAI